MGLRESFGEMSTGAQIVVVLGVAFVGFVGFTVVLSAIIGTFVLGLGDTTSTTSPIVSFDYHVDGGEVEVVHDGGEFVAAERLLVTVNGDGQSWATLDPDVSSGGIVEPGDSVTVSGVVSGDTITLRWVPPDGGESTVVGRHVVT